MFPLEISESEVERLDTCSELTRPTVTNGLVFSPVGSPFAHSSTRRLTLRGFAGKGFDWGGSKIRPEATGYGLVYYVEHMIREARGEDFKGKTVAISGAGNVAQVSLLFPSHPSTPDDTTAPPTLR